MRIQILISALFFSTVALAHPIDCYVAATQDRVIKFSDDLKSQLCRKAKSTAPYECFAKVYTNSNDFRISSTLAVPLCQGAEDADRPLACFNLALTKLNGKLNNLEAAKLCSGSSAPAETVACFEKAKATLALSSADAADLCAH